jgi:hypothetical protein
MQISRVAKSASLVAGATILGLCGIATAAQASPSAGYIGYGYSNNAHGVWCVQHLVNDVEQAQGHGRPLTEDGLWGPNTYNGVRWYQAHNTHGTTVDGIVGKDTGGWLLLDGDSYYGGYNYCYTYVPSYF